MLMLKHTHNAPQHTQSEGYVTFTIGQLDGP